MITLAIDVGKSSGWAIRDQHGFQCGGFQFESLAQYKSKVTGLLNTYSPDVVVTGKPVRYYRTLVAHSKYQAIVELCCEMQEVPYVEVVDSTCKKLISGGGKCDKECIKKWAVSKDPEVIPPFPKKMDDAYDAMMFAEFISKNAVNVV